ncbi:hypothetical protein PAHAL_1G181600 [Panicum hallii]|uniref:Uncharacterized protein n=1 Tax=Panicum hallii TaxID=206008 RepID=A0A2T8KVL8_9POAL|nr:hypothetical protein PAHAL_1G181600 [Panicum hallii]PVH66227.1 hypothetical protein PAHAL_1G181600 [Panicum hallii]PVH66228.1 hypothetical protein PAHAL_1G181600 [Panicum hallii]PVH66229.1 hypothetical protein PAHAL_1G181600 [Panicum hallii]
MPPATLSDSLPPSRAPPPPFLPLALRRRAPPPSSLLTTPLSSFLATPQSPGGGAGGGGRQWRGHRRLAGRRISAGGVDGAPTLGCGVVGGAAPARSSGFRGAPGAAMGPAAGGGMAVRLGSAGVGCGWPAGGVGGATPEVVEKGGGGGSAAAGGGGGQRRVPLARRASGRTLGDPVVLLVGISLPAICGVGDDLATDVRGVQPAGDGVARCTNPSAVGSSST